MEKGYSKKKIETIEDFTEIVSTEREIERRYGEFPCIWMSGIGGEIFRSKEFYKEFQSRNKNLDDKLTKTISNSPNPMGEVIEYKEDFFEAYKKFKELGVKDEEILIRHPYD